jgi:two-component system, NtrC family, nitrogen regulation sensor histidine kinase NtrY
MKQPGEIRSRDLLVAFRFLLVAIVILIVALIFDPIAHQKESVKVHPAQIEKDFHRKIKVLEKVANEALSLVTKHGWPQVLDEDPGFTGRFAKDDDGIALFILQQDSMLFWTDNSLVVETRDLLQMESGRVYTLPNCSVYSRIYRSDQFKVIGFVFLKKFFPYNNELVSNAFLVGKNIPESYRISIPPVPDAIQVADDQGRFAFSLIPSEEVTSRETLHRLTLFLYFLVFAFILFFFGDIMRLAFRVKPTGWWLLALLADLFIVRLFFWYFREPHCAFNLAVFTPFNQPLLFLESRGDMLITIVLLIFFAVWFSRFFELFTGRGSGTPGKSEKRLIQSLALAGWLLAIASFLGATLMIRYLLLQRTGLLEVFRILTIDFSNFLDILMVAGILVAFVLVLYRLINRIKSRLTWIQSIIGLVMMSALCFGLARDTDAGIDWISLIFFLLLSVIILSVQKYSRIRFNHGLVTIILVIISAFIVFSIDRVNKSKEADQHLMILKKLSSEHDQIAEMLLSQIDPDIRTDSVLADLVLNRNMKPDNQKVAITNYLKNKYFGLYWNRFEIQAYSCNAESRMIIQPDNTDVYCLDYFLRDMRDKFGKMLTGTAGFYYLDNFDGVVEYIGVYDHFSTDPENRTSLIINIYSRFVAQELGYPELLITGKIDRDSLDPSYSYAKYHLGNLQLTSGDYDYSLTSDIYPGKIGEVVGFKLDGYNHWIKKIDNNNEIVISHISHKTNDKLIAFSYVFVFLFLIWLLLNAILNWPRGFKFPVLGLKQRIQFTMVSFLVFSFLLIGGGMTYYVIQQYKQNNRKLIIEKTESLLADLQGKLATANVLTKDWQDENYRGLNELMIKFSYVFNTDMNIFDPYGNLVVSSRPEVFEYNLAGHKMNPIAYEVIHHQGKPRFIVRESIESLGYYSSYVPLYNQYNKLLGYLNLPYFSRQSETSREVSTIVVAMVNAYFILILLTVFLAVIMANQVARPLQLLQSKLAGLRFGRKNQSIEYRRDDEIGRLVKEYNRMVSELQASAEKLARSERESAWREMARQIAHEIKNPLTPMKLSVQHLRKAWKDGAPDLDVYIDRMTNTLIDQIETLSNIANEFSKFAQVPSAHFEAIDLTQKIQRITHLFEDTCTVNLINNYKKSREILIFADPEQVIQVFNNLIRNAVQAVAAGVEPVVDISIEASEDSVIVKLTDNGIGIPEELQPRLFEPNFTTKTSGMGLGLAIAKKIMEGSNGRIWFETRKNSGTSFFLEWPLFKPE